MTYHVSHLITVPATIEGINIDAILDTGAAVNIASGEFARRSGQPIRPATSAVRGVNGELASSEGVVELAVNIGPVHVQATFVVLTGCPYDILCGLPFCTDSNLVLDFPNNAVFLQGHFFPLRLDDDISPPLGDKEPIRAHCTRQTKVPPHSEVLLEVSIAMNGTFVVEPEIKLKDTPQPVVARTLTNVSCNRGFVRIANPSPSALTIARGATIGRTTPLQEVEISTSHAKRSHGRLQDVEISDNVPAEEKEAIRALLQQYSHLFSTDESPVGLTHVIEHEIETGNARPIHQNPYRKAVFERQVIEEQVNEMLRKGVIRESSSPWSSPVVLVRKRDASWRFCVDFRRLNAVTKKDVHPVEEVEFLYMSPDRRCWYATERR
ncbi:uncharacterized protein LOC135398460 [Ornithodoros turicata]|uniref:uncharacterized protein LOC135398460 n=1 Tax=Ornithodoros turicata TaxID=34597 RepID=UPI003138E0C0